MNVVNYLPHNIQMRQYELNAKALLYSHCFGTVLRRTRHSPCGSKSFLNSRLSSTRLLLNCFLIKSTCKQVRVSCFTANRIKGD